MSERGKSRWIYVELRLSLYLYFRNSLGDNLMSITSRILPYKMKIAEQRRAEYRAWHDREFATPLPNDAKRSVLSRYGYPQETWVETGTYLGETTAFLSKNSNKVITIEPSEELFSKAANRFKSSPNVEVLPGGSEDVFPDLLPRLSGKINFWLDGHHSGGNTYLGALDTPLTVELNEISRNLGHFSSVAVFIDDIRFCSPAAGTEYNDYPSLDFLVDWSRRNSLKWLIEHDIFVARSSF